MNDLNYIKLFLTIMLSMTFAILISGSVFKYWFEYEAKALIEEASLSLQKAQEERKEKQRLAKIKHDKK